jgi:hypothetical protein
MSTGRNNADICPQTRKKPYVSSYIASAIYHCFFKVNKSLSTHDLRFQEQMSPKFVSLITTTLQWHFHTHVATGKAEQALLCNSINAGGE